MVSGVSVVLNVFRCPCLNSANSCSVLYVLLSSIKLQTYVDFNWHNFQLYAQECKDFHQAKDGDGWVEQSSKSLLFGILQQVCTTRRYWVFLFKTVHLIQLYLIFQVETPSAYVCADGKIYDATEWYICQVISVM